MFDLDVEQLNVPAMHIAAGHEAARGDAVDGVLGVCKLTPRGPLPANVPAPATYHFSPAVNAAQYLAEFKGKEEMYNYLRDPNARVTVTLLKAPTHGRFDGLFYMHPEPDYLGEDRADFLVEIANYKVKVVYFIQVVPSIGSRGYAENCPTPRLWKISLENGITPGAVTPSAQLLPQSGSIRSMLRGS